VAKATTMRNKHQKHAFLAKPKGGQFHTNEWTVIGAPCGVLKSMVEYLSQGLEKQGLKTGYLDMSHQSETLNTLYSVSMVDKLDHWTLANNQTLQQRDYRKYFNGLDLLFVNGNHYKGDNQLVFINTKKKESLERKLDRLTNVAAFILDEGETALHDYLENYKTEGTPIFSIDNGDKLAAYILAKHLQALPQIKGLVLKGGKSIRMGSHKGEIHYHDKKQEEHAADLLNDLGSETYYSVASKSSASSYPEIEDSFIGLGPFGGILSAFRSDPNSAWLTIACDQPYLDEGTLTELVKARNPSKLATCFYNPETDFPEPLITLWEPRAYPVLLDYLAQGYSCPRKVLINSDIEMINMSDPTKMRNANTPEERLAAEAQLKNT